MTLNIPKPPLSNQDIFANKDSYESNSTSGISCHFECGTERDPGGLQTAKSIYQTGKEAVDFLSRTTSTCNSGNILCDLVMSSLELLDLSGGYTHNPEKLRAYYARSETLIISRIMCLDDASTHELCGIFNHILALMQKQNQLNNDRLIAHGIR